MEDLGLGDARALAGPAEHPGIMDFLVLLGSCAAKRIGHAAVWDRFAHSALTLMVCSLAQKLETAVIAAAAEDQRPFRLLRADKSQRCRRVEPANRIAVEEKLAQVQPLHLHAGTSRKMLSEVAPCGKNEQQLADVARVMVYQDKLVHKFAPLQVKHLSVCADASLHNNEDTLVLVVHSWLNDVAAYLPLQVLCKPKRIRLREDIAELMHEKKIDRLPAYAQLLAIDHALQLGTGCSLADFAVPNNCIIRPLTADESRILDPRTNQWSVYNHKTGACVAELPALPAQLPVLTVFADQGSIGWAGLHFAMHHMHLLAGVFPDPSHRVWNDIKLAAQHCSCYLWRTICELCLVFNVNYGPFGKGHWFSQKQESFKEMR